MYFDKNIKKILTVLLFTTLAYCLFFIFIILYNQPRGFYSYFDSFFYGYFMHMPLWLLGFIVVWKLNNSFFRLNFMKLKKLLAFIAIIIFILLIISEKLESYFNYIYIPFLILDFCLWFFISNIIIKSEFRGNG
jgi:hypothetical protein